MTVTEPRPVLRVGALGAGFIGQMHSLALRLARLSRAPCPELELVMLADRDPTAAAGVAERYGWQQTVSEWEALASEDLGLFINAAPNHLHREPSVAVAQTGCAVFCEKPLAASASEAFEIWAAVAARAVDHRCAFIHRFVPALQRARRMIAAGELGEIRQYRSKFLLDMGDPDQLLSWRYDVTRAGSGAIGDLGSHHIDLARFLVAEIESVSAVTRTWTNSTQFEINDDAFACVARLANGATAVFEASRRAAGHTLTGMIEIDGTEGSLAWSMERLNELDVRRPGQGVSTRLVTGQDDPYVDMWLPAGIQGSHPIGWQECFAHQTLDVVGLASGLLTESVAATLEDGYRVAEIVDAIVRSAHSGATERPDYRELPPTGASC